MLGLTSQYHGPSTITAWSSGTGFAGPCCRSISKPTTAFDACGFSRMVLRPKIDSKLFRRPFSVIPQRAA